MRQDEREIGKEAIEIRQNEAKTEQVRQDEKRQNMANP